MTYSAMGKMGMKDHLNLVVRNTIAQTKKIIKVIIASNLSSLGFIKYLELSSTVA
jgi:hypothetical protein